MFHHKTSWLQTRSTLGVIVKNSLGSESVTLASYYRKKMFTLDSRWGKLNFFVETLFQNLFERFRLNTVIESQDFLSLIREQQSQCIKEENTAMTSRRVTGNWIHELQQTKSYKVVCTKLWDKNLSFQTSAAMRSNRNQDEIFQRG